MLWLSAGAWLAGCLAGLVGILTPLADYDRVRAALRASAAAHDPTAPPDVLASGVRTTVLVAALPGLLLVVAVVLVTALLLARRPWARWVLLGSAPLTLLAAGLAWQVLGTGSRPAGAALGTQAALVGLGVLTLFAPPVRAWLLRLAD